MYLDIISCTVLTGESLNDDVHNIEARLNSIVFEILDPDKFLQKHNHFMYSQVKPEAAGINYLWAMKIFIASKHLYVRTEM